MSVDIPREGLPSLVENPVKNPVDRVKLNFYLWAEGVLNDRLAGKPTPIPLRIKYGLAFTAIALVGGFSSVAVVSELSSRDVCSNPDRYLVDNRAEHTLSLLEPPLALASPEFGGGPTEVLNSSNRVSAGSNLALFNSSNLEIEVSPNSLRGTLGKEILGMDIPDSVTTLYVFLPFSYSDIQAREYFEGMKNNAKEQMFLKMPLGARKTGRSFIEYVPIYDAFDRVLRNYRVKDNQEFRRALSEELLVEMRVATIRGLTDLGLTHQLPPPLNERQRSSLTRSGAVQVRQINRAFLKSACISYLRTRGSN